MDRNRFSAIIVFTLTAATFAVVTPSPAFQSKAGQPKTAAKSKATQPKAAAQNTIAPGQPGDPKIGDVKVNPVDQQRYVWIPPGNFRAGCSVGDKECYEDETPTRQITLTKGFWLAETEVTQKAWAHVAIEDDPSLFHGPSLPVEMADWKQANAFCTKIGGRLPSEAEWEWAARGGTTGARYGNLDEIAWYVNNSGTGTHPVKQKKPNAFGLYDMLGNVVEWTNTYYTVQHSQENVNPQGPSTAEYRSLRGGGWWDDPDLIRVSYRRHFENGDFDYNIGFRCVSN